ncbi:hypothetical protein HY251_06385, partial [bacterium]|nr:hypothetical protein [bacterium]
MTTDQTTQEAATTRPAAAQALDDASEEGMFLFSLGSTILGVVALIFGGGMWLVRPTDGGATLELFQKWYLFVAAGFGLVVL